MYPPTEGCPVLKVLPSNIHTAASPKVYVTNGRKPGRMSTYGCGSKPMVPFWGRCTTHFRTYSSGDWDVHWGYDLDFGPWP